MPSIGPRCHELRVRDRTGDWRVIYRVDPDEILIVHVFKKTTQVTPGPVMDLARTRLSEHDRMEKTHGDD